MTPGFSGLIALDDIDKPDDMFSKVKREKNHVLLKNTIRSRRAKKKKGDETPILSVQQRLHAQDATWFMMSGGMAIDFDRIVIPAMSSSATCFPARRWSLTAWNTGHFGRRTNQSRTLLRYAKPIFIRSFRSISRSQSPWVVTCSSRSGGAITAIPTRRTSRARTSSNIRSSRRTPRRRSRS